MGARAGQYAVVSILHREFSRIRSWRTRRSHRRRRRDQIDRSRTEEPATRCEDVAARHHWKEGRAIRRPLRVIRTHAWPMDRGDESCGGDRRWIQHTGKIRRTGWLDLYSCTEGPSEAGCPLPE